MRIITVTLNPALDKTARLDVLQPGHLNRLRDVVVDAGGKGINVSKMIAALGGTSLATGFIGGGSGAEIIRSLDKTGIGHAFVPIESPTRTNLKLVDGTGGLTELNEPGPQVTPAELARLEEMVRSHAGPGSLFVFSGSVPSGLQPGIYRDLIRTVKAAGSQAFLDADGEAFRLAVEAGPEFIKPNRFELLQYYGVSASASADPAELLGLCRRLLKKGVGKVVVSMGADGACFVTADDAFRCPGLKVDALSTVGAGDSMVGAVAFAGAKGLSWRETAALAMASGAGAVTTVGTKPPARELVDRLLTQVEFIQI